MDHTDELPQEMYVSLCVPCRYNIEAVAGRGYSVRHRDNLLHISKMRQREYRCMLTISKAWRDLSQQKKNKKQTCFFLGTKTDKTQLLKLRLKDLF